MSPEELMLVALRAARRGLGRTRPNPPVGCVVVRKGRIVATGFHSRAGASHAEIVALRRARGQAKGADVYITLEPCDHFGRTPPCTEALIAAGVKRVIVGMKDPHPIVNGRGIRRLRAAGIDVQVGLLKHECQNLNEAFVHYVTNQMPFVVAKFAQSLDGRVATRAGESQWITSEAARRASQKLRNTLDAIAVGVGTVLKDDPRLTCRIRGGRNPVRVIVDTQARTPAHAKALNNEAPTIMVVGEHANVHHLQKTSATILRCSLKEGRIDVASMLTQLADQEITSLLVEGGPTLLGSFFDLKLVNKVYAFVAPMIIGGIEARSSIEGQGIARLKDAIALRKCTARQVGQNFEICGYC